MTDDKLRAALDVTARAYHDGTHFFGASFAECDRMRCKANRAALAASATDEGPPHQGRAADTKADGESIDRANQTARPAVPALDVAAVKAALPDLIYDDKSWEWTDGTVARTQDEKANVIAAKISEYAALSPKEPTE